ncbi:MAG: type II secretion system F family protein [Deltaproteobacteria bacterium]|nr:type II secretion system F family protein [Deltaproteobacteria bacterium]
MSPLLTAVATGGLLLVVGLGVVLWLTSAPADADLERRLRSVAGVLATGPGLGAGEADGNVFRRQRAQSRLSDWIQRRFPMLEVRKAFPKAVALGFVAMLAVAVAALLLQLGVYLPLLMPAGWVAGGWLFLALRNSAIRTQFVKQFPEVVDHVVRLTRAGLPAVEAITAVAEEAQEPVKGIIRQVSDHLAGGLDPEVVLRETATRLRIPEFTLFSAALCLQRTTGGGISAALGNLSATLRARLEVEMKAHSSTAQTRITLWVLSAVPVVVLGAQSFTNPQALEILLETESGGSLLRWGVGLIVAGLSIARGLAARFAR